MKPNQTEIGSSKNGLFERLLSSLAQVAFGTAAAETRFLNTLLSPRLARAKQDVWKKAPLCAMYSKLRPKSDWNVQKTRLKENPLFLVESAKERGGLKVGSVIFRLC